MNMGWGKRLAVTIAGVSAVGAPSEIANAQEFGSGLEITGSVRLRAEVDDNGPLEDDSPGTDSIFGTDLEIGIRSEGDISRLDLSFGGTLQTEDRADRPNDNGLVDQFVNLNYALEGPSNGLFLNGRFQRRDLEDDFFDDPDFDDVDLINDRGTLDITSFDATFDMGIDRPLGATLSYSLRDRSYDDTADPDLTDSTTHTFRASGNARPSEVLTFSAFVEVEDYEDEGIDAVDRETTRTGVSAIYEFDPVHTLQGEVFYEDVDETRLVLGTPTDFDNDGLGFEIGLIREVPDGAFRFSVEREITTFTIRNEFRAGRVFELPDGGLSVELGVSDTDNSDPEVIGSLLYERDMPRGLLTASLERTSVVNDDDEIRLRNFGRLNYDHEISPVDSILFGIEFAQSETIGPLGDDDVTNARLDIVYSRQINEDWDWRVGYRARYRDEDGGDSATSNALIMSFGRSFSLRP